MTYAQTVAENVIRIDQDAGKDPLSKLRNEKNEAVLRQKIDSLKNGSVDDLLLLYRYYEDDNSNKIEIVKKMMQDFPDHRITGMARMNLFMALPAGNEQGTLLESWITKYPTMNFDVEKLVVSLVDVKNFEPDKALKWAQSIDDEVLRLMGVADVIMELTNYDRNKALVFAESNVDNFKRLQGMSDLNASIPPDDVYCRFLLSYSKLLFHAGREQEAFQYAPKAYACFGNQDRELAEIYGLLISVFDENYEEALPILTRAVREGKNDERYLREIRKAYAVIYPGRDVDVYLDAMLNQFKKAVREKVAKLSLDEPAPEFVVTDINGQKVTLADFKGKVVVLDFWATWCAPCIESFPAMQLAVNRYADDPEVAFLFIHSWENVDDPLTAATNLLTKSNYDFDLYMDPRQGADRISLAATAFGVSAIPAKFVIDGEGRIRFNLSGFEGNNEQAAEELVQMIEWARNK